MIITFTLGDKRKSCSIISQTVSMNYYLLIGNSLDYYNPNCFIIGADKTGLIVLNMLDDAINTSVKHKYICLTTLYLMSITCSYVYVPIRKR